MEYRLRSVLISQSAGLSRNGLPHWVSPLWPELCVFPSMEKQPQGGTEPNQL